MGLISAFFMALSLSLDALAVSVATGIAAGGIKPRHALKAGLFFGGFQGLMPLIGSIFGGAMGTFFGKVDHWIAFFLLCFIGARMIMGRTDNEDHAGVRPEDTLRLTLLAVATSLDALAVGFGLSAAGQDVRLVALLAALVTAVLCILGVYLGKKLGNRFLDNAMRAGGSLLCATGMRILIEHLL